VSEAHAGNARATLVLQSRRATRQVLDRLIALGLIKWECDGWIVTDGGRRVLDHLGGLQ
jgi:ribosomal protein S19E (S16A)